MKTNTDILLFSQFPKSISGLPSWVSDWQAPINIPYGYFDLNTSAFSAGGETSSPQIIPHINVNSGTLTIRGYKIGVIDAVGKCILHGKGGWDIHNSVNPRSFKLFIDELESFLAYSSSLPNSPYASEESRKEAVFRIPGGGLSIYFGKRNIAEGSKEVLQQMHEQMKIRGNNEIAVEQIPRKLADRFTNRPKIPLYAPNTIDLLRLYAIKPQIVYMMSMFIFVYYIFDIFVFGTAILYVWLVYQKDLLSRRLPTVTQAYQQAGLDAGVRQLPQLGEYRASLFKNINRLMFLTNNGFVGLCPPQTRARDVIVVFPGCTVPCVLRLNLERRYTFVGEAFCDGFMYGEALKVGAEKTFTIV